MESRETIPWVEKYRPQQLNDVISHQHIISTLRNLIKNNKLPHTIFYGPSGTGKTSTILACAREIYGDAVNAMILELNGSDDRGINIVREQIKDFSSTNNYLFSNPLKLVILDEVDSMTYDAQFALRQVIENNVSNTRFCFICNYITKIIPGIQSRCVAFNFSPISDGVHLQHIKDIIKKENMTVTDECAKEMIKIAEGDMRKSLNVLQALYLANLQKKIDINELYQIIGYPNPSIKNEIIDTILDNNISDAYSMITALRKNNNLCVQDILKELVEYVINSGLNNIKMARILSELAKIETYLANNVNEDVQMGAIIAAIKLNS